jgi:hypothetical protein
MKKQQPQFKMPKTTKVEPPQVIRRRAPKAEYGKPKHSKVAY